MADTQMEDVDPDSQSHDSSSSAGSASDSSNAVETLIAGRERRANAGNRMTALVQEEDDKQEDADEVTLLFAQEEDEIDEDFQSDEAEEGGDELTSSDDEDEGQNAGGDDLEGERTLLKQEKADKAKKRKAELALTSGAALRKKVKIDPNLPSKSSQPKKPSKRREKSGWAQVEGSRQSSRTHTQLQTETTQVRLREDEIRSAKLRADREKKERQKQREQPQREVTQADRLAEAARIERKNLKSLNRWEESEKKRAEEQAAKLAALKDRSLSGPIVSWWSGKAKWSGPRLTMVGNKETTETRRASISIDEPKKRGRKSNAFHAEQAALREAEAGKSSLGTPRGESMTPAPSEPTATPVPESVNVPAPENIQRDSGNADTSDAAIPSPALPPNPFLQGIQEYASMQSQVTRSGTEKKPQPDSAPEASNAPVTITPPEPVVAQDSTRNLVILNKFDSLSPDERRDFQLFYNKKAAKIAKPEREMCPVTSSQARYRDPSTGIPYNNSFAFKKLQELKRHQYTWSDMLNCFVGKTGVVARGVPDSFLGAGNPMRDVQGELYIRPQPPPTTALPPRVQPSVMS